MPIKSDFFASQLPIGKHGILLEKYATIATDAFRAQALELCGYRTQGNGVYRHGAYS